MLFFARTWPPSTCVGVVESLSGFSMYCYCVVSAFPVRVVSIVRCGVAAQVLFLQHYGLGRIRSLRQVDALALGWGHGSVPWALFDACSGEVHVLFRLSFRCFKFLCTSAVPVAIPVLRAQRSTQDKW